MSEQLPEDAERVIPVKDITAWIAGKVAVSSAVELVMDAGKPENNSDTMRRGLEIAKQSGIMETLGELQHFLDTFTPGEE